MRSKFPQCTVSADRAAKDGELTGKADGAELAAKVGCITTTRTVLANFLGGSVSETTTGAICAHRLGALRLEFADWAVNTLVQVCVVTKRTHGARLAGRLTFQTVEVANRAWLTNRETLYTSKGAHRAGKTLVGAFNADVLAGGAIKALTETVGRGILPKGAVSAVDRPVVRVFTGVALAARDLVDGALTLSADIALSETSCTSIFVKSTDNT